MKQLPDRRARLLAGAGALAREPAPVLTAGWLKKVRAVAGSTPQPDHITIPALEVRRLVDCVLEKEGRA